ncbi:MAG: hypothetical protein WD669_10180 [Pirellulales bacterium]
MDDDLSLYGDVGDLYERHGEAAGNPEHPDFPKFAAELESFAKAGHVEAAQALGDELSAPGPCYRPDEAYKWYYIGLSQQGYTTGWDDQNYDPPHYCGPVGDFRNEGMVSCLVAELGWERVHQLDKEAHEWMAEHGLTSGDN